MLDRNRPFFRSLHEVARTSALTAGDLLAVLNREHPQLAADMIVTEARRVASHSEVHYLPVVDAKSHLVGVVCRCALEAAPLGVKVEDCLRRPTLAVTAHAPIASAASLIIEGGVGCLPVLEGAQVLGVLTRGDLLSVGALSEGSVARCAECGSYNHVTVRLSGQARCRRCAQGASRLDAPETDEPAFGD